MLAEEMSGKSSESAGHGQAPKPSPRSAFRSMVRAGVDTGLIKHCRAGSETIPELVSFLVATAQDGPTLAIARWAYAAAILAQDRLGRGGCLLRRNGDYRVGAQ